MSALASWLGGIAALVSANAQPGAPSAGAWVSEVRISRGDLRDPAAPLPATLRQGGFGLNAWQEWITPDDMPADLRTRTMDTMSYVSIEIDPSGRPTGCRTLQPSEDPRLDALACRLLAERGQFPASYVAPGRTGAVIWLMQVKWRTESRADHEARLRQQLLAPPAPPPPPPSRLGTGSWPRMEWPDQVELAALPDVQAALPRGVRVNRSATVSIEISVDASGITGCAVGVSSGNPALDEASCAVGRSLQLRYVSPCHSCRPTLVPVEVVWRERRGSHIRFPLARALRQERRPPLRHAEDRRTEETYQARYSQERMMVAPTDFPGVADLSVARPFTSVNVAIDRRGNVTGCRTGLGSGNPAIDARLCHLARQMPGLRPVTDVFGDPMDGEVVISVDLRSLGPVTRRDTPPRPPQTK